MRSSVTNVQEWMRKSDDLVSEITNLVAFNDPANTTNCFPHHVDEIRKGVNELGYRDVNEFCASFPTKFMVDGETGVISLHMQEKNRVVNRLEEEKKYKETEIFPNEEVQGDWKLSEDTISALASLFPPPPTTPINVVETEEPVSPVKKTDNIHFKISHEGKTRRFAITRDDSDLIGTVKNRVQKIIGNNVSLLFWRDEDSPIVLECEEDMFAAIHFAETCRKPACILLEVTIEDKEMKIEEEEGTKVEKSVNTSDEQSREPTEIIKMTHSSLSIEEIIRQTEFPEEEDPLKTQMEEWRKRDEDTLKKLQEMRISKDFEMRNNFREDSNEWTADQWKMNLQQKQIPFEKEESPEERRMRHWNKQIRIAELEEAEMKKKMEKEERKEKTKDQQFAEVMEEIRKNEWIEKEKKEMKMKKQLKKDLCELKTRTGKPLEERRQSSKQVAKMEKMKTYMMTSKSKKKEKIREEERKVLDGIINEKIEKMKKRAEMISKEMVNSAVDNDVNLIVKDDSLLSRTQLLEEYIVGIVLQPPVQLAAPAAPDVITATSVGDISERCKAARGAQIEENVRRMGEKLQKKLLLPKRRSIEPVAAPEAEPREDGKNDAVWKAERWLSFVEGEMATEKFLKDREEFISRGDEILRIPAHLEQNLLKEMIDHTSVDALLKRLNLLQCLVHNNIRMHVFQEHEVMFTENKDVENEIIRVIATDLASRLEKMRKRVAPVLPQMRERLISGRIDELEAQLKEKPTQVVGCRFAALNLRPILTTSVYKISYDPNESGFERAFERANEFSVQLKMQASEKVAEESNEKAILNVEQQELLEKLFNTGIFQDFDRMVEVCRTARNLDQAIEMMVNE